MTDNKTLRKIRESFTLQAKNFESGNMNFSKQDYLSHTVTSLSLKGDEKVLDAASVPVPMAGLLRLLPAM